MTNKELLIQMLQDGTTLELTDIMTKVDAIIAAQENAKPGSSQGFYEELTQADAESRLRRMRDNRAAIVQWFLSAYERAVGS